MTDGTVTGSSVADGCPSWCVVDHGEPGAPEGHIGPGRPISSLQRRPIPGGSHEGAAVELVVVPVRDRGGTWLYVGDGTTQWLELSVESWLRLGEAVGVYVHELRTPPPASD